jgi:hypothetical protein
MKVRMTQTLEANVAFGEDNAFGWQLRGSDEAAQATNYSNLARNRTVFGNVIYRPKTYLVFSAEYRNLRSWPIAGRSNANDGYGFAAGYIF